MDIQGVAGDDWESQLIDYSLGAMEPGEAETFAASLEECRTHVRLAQRYEQVVAWLGASVAPAEPPQGHKSRLMTRVSSTAQAEAQRPGVLALSAPTEVVREDARITELARYREERRRRNTLVAVMGAVAAALILLVGLWGWNANNEAQQAREEATRLNQEIAKRDQQVHVPEGYKPLLLAPLSAQGPVTNVVALVFYNPEKNDAILVADRLPAQPTGKVYELWLLPTGANEIPTAAGVFTPDPQGSSKHEASAPKKVGEYAGFAVSIEDAPGLPVGKPPAGPVVLAGTFAAP
jgi:anti-sigma-K factor RskA